MDPHGYWELTDTIKELEEGKKEISAEIEAAVMLVETANVQAEREEKFLTYRCRET